AEWPASAAVRRLNTVPVHYGAPYRDGPRPGIVATAHAGRAVLGLAVQCALELVEVVVVVPRHERHEVVDRDRAARGVNAGARPLLGREGPEQGERLVAPLPEGAERLLHVVPEILPLLGPTIGRGGIERKLRIVHRQDQPEPPHEHLLDIAQVTDDLLGRP